MGKSFSQIDQVIPATLDRPAAGGLRGQIDAIAGAVLTGWCLDIAHPAQVVELSLWLDAQPLGPLRTGQPRPDIAARLPGAARAGFRIDLAQAGTARQRSAVAAMLAGGGIDPGRIALRAVASGQQLATAGSGAAQAALDSLLAAPDPVTPPGPATATAGANAAQARRPANGGGEAAAITAHLDATFYRAGFAQGAAPPDPVQHYLTTGWREGRDPAPWFSTAGYLALHGDVKVAGINPFVHYLQQGRTERRALAAAPRPGAGGKAAPDAGPDARAARIYAAHARACAPGPDYEDPDPGIGAGRAPLARVLAYYLPQYHAVPVNDRNWGKGFTEWRNLMRGQPRFEGHVQPRIPRDLGFYDLAQGDVMARQIALARAGGVQGFCFYHYWFDGERVLDRPVERMLADPGLDFPFCLMWANENWTRTWDGFDAQVILKQSYNPADDAALLADFARHFRDPRYIRIGGRPLLFLYRPGQVPQSRATLARWRARFQGDHGENPLILMAQGFDDHDPRAHGLDGAIEFPPHKICAGQPWINDQLALLDPGFSGMVLSYDEAVHRATSEPAPDFPLIRTVTPSWDNESRRPGRGMVLHGSTPRKFEDWAARAIDFARRHPVEGEAIVAVNAWNEWAEGAVLEPCVHYGGAYLNALARAVYGRRSRAEGPQHKVLILGHDAHRNGAQMLALSIGRQLRAGFGVQVAYVLAAGGPLHDEYAAIGHTQVMSFADPKLPALLERLHAEGFDQAIANTTVTGGFLPALRKAGFRSLSLIHELRRVIEGYDLGPQARAVARDAHQVIFPAQVVRDSFESLIRASRGKEARRDAPPGTPAGQIAGQSAGKSAGPTGDQTRDQTGDQTGGQTGGPIEGKVEILTQGLYQTALLDRPRQDGGLRAELGLAPDTKLVIGVGYADLRKGIDRFIALAIALCARRDDVAFVWVGNAAPEARDWHLPDIALAGLSHRIWLTGHVDDVARWYAAADAVLLTSREDPFPSVVMEAMAMGLPVLGYAGTGGCDALIAEHGALLPAADPEAMLAAIGTELDRPEPERQAADARRRAVIARDYPFDRYCLALLQRLDPDLASVSVVVPNYNYARYIGDRLRSLFRQSHPVLEVIVLDDASTDDSLAQIRQTATEEDRLIRLVVNEVNAGSPFRQWRRGLEMARGDYVWIAEADDLADPAFLDRLARRMAQTGAALGFCDSWQIDAAGERLGDSYRPYLNTVEPGAFDRSFVMEGPEFLARFLAVRNVILNVSGVLLRRDALLAAMEAVGEDLADFSVAGDWRLYAQICAAGGRVVYEAAALNGHRRHATSVTHALKVDRHLAEIAQMQAWAAAQVPLDPATVLAQKDHMAECRRHLGVE